MYGQNPFYNPEPLIYRNKQYIRQYLAGPGLLILAILQTVASILSVLSSFFYSSISADVFDALSASMQESTGESIVVSSSSTVSLPLLSIALAVSFFLMYFCARSKKENSAIKGSVTFFWALTIVQLVINALLVAALTLLILAIALLLPSAIYMVNSFNSQMDSFGADVSSATGALSTVMIILIIVMAIITAFILFYSISQLRFAASIRKSVTTPTLSAKGAKATGVSYVIFSVFSVISLLFSAIILFVALFIPDGNIANSNLVFDKNTLLVIGATSAITNFISLSCYIYMAKFAFGYKKHIIAAGPKGSYLPVPVMAVNVAEQPNYQPGPAHCAANTVAPDSAEVPSQTAFMKPVPEQEPKKPACTECATEPISETPDAPQNNRPKFCSQCGTPTVEGQNFCSKCGTKTI